MQLNDERIAAFDAIEFDWTSQKYVTRSFDERMQYLEEYMRTHGNVNVKIHEGNSLGQFCANLNVRRTLLSRRKFMELTDERIAALQSKVYRGRGKWLVIYPSVTEFLSNVGLFKAGTVRPSLNNQQVLLLAIKAKNGNFLFKIRRRLGVI